MPVQITVAGIYRLSLFDSSMGDRFNNHKSEASVPDDWQLLHTKAYYHIQSHLQASLFLEEAHGKSGSLVCQHLQEQNI